MRAILILLATLILLAAAAPAGALNARQRAKLEQVQNVWSSAMRWSDYEGAWQLVDPDERAARPMTELELERYQQLQVSSYREGGNGELEDGTVVRDVQVGVINRHTQAERIVRFQERWRWDPAGKRWWQAGRLPDFWRGE